MCAVRTACRVRGKVESKGSTCKAGAASKGGSKRKRGVGDSAGNTGKKRKLEAAIVPFRLTIILPFCVACRRGKVVA